MVLSDADRISKLSKIVLFSRAIGLVPRFIFPVTWFSELMWAVRDPENPGSAPRWVTLQGLTIHSGRFFTSRLTEAGNCP
jgi:hypothetical protein